MAPNKQYTWSEVIRTKNTFGKFLIFGSPYFCMSLFYYAYCVRPKSLLPTPTVSPIIIGVGVAADAASSPSSSSSSPPLTTKKEDQQSTQHAAQQQQKPPLHMFGRQIEPIYGAGYVAPPPPPAAKRSWLSYLLFPFPYPSFSFFSSSNSTTAEKATSTTSPPQVITGYKFA